MFRLKLSWLLLSPLLVAAADSKTRLPAGAMHVSVSMETQPFSEQWLKSRAQRLSEKAYDTTAPHIPRSLSEMNYDQYRQIRFRNEAAVWKGENLGFELQLFHVGHFYNAPVTISVVDRGKAHRLRFDRSLFDYGANRIDEPLPETTGFAGFRIHHPLNHKEAFDELLVFLGASYFRALGKGNAYGLSARGLAIDTATPGGEVFPVFREFFVEKPKPGAKNIVVHALLDSPNATGAYRFDVYPGENTEIRVSATLYPRKGIERLGIAPLTSMYLHGENDRGVMNDYRPEVHDSDGLLIWFGNGERLWRPLQNPDKLRVSVLGAESVKGFGLYQRDRAFAHYEDLEARYERRPSVWVEPAQGFGRGSIYLIEIPTREDIHDNIVAFFTPQEKPVANKAMHVAYRMFWGMGPGPRVGPSAAMATHVGAVQAIPQADDPRPARKFAIDFASPEKSSDPDGVEAVVTVASGKVQGAHVQSHPDIGGLRATFEFTPENDEPVEMRCFLREKNVALSETWSYLHAPLEVKQ